MSSPVRILVIEDEVLCALHLQTLLADLGFDNIHCVHNLAAGARLLASETPGLAILDVDVGGVLIFPLAEGLRTRNVPIVFTTGRSCSAFPPEWAAYPIAGKPLVHTVLDAAIRAAGLAA